jgi:Flp pilus assembly protein TadG
MVMIALAIVGIMTIVAIVVDLGNARQQRRQADAVADTAALSGASTLSDTPPGNGQLTAIQYAMKSLSLTEPANAAALGFCGTNCSTYTQGGRTVDATSPWNGHANWVHVKVCWPVPAQFAGIVNSSSLTVCGQATAENTGAAGGGGVPQSSCTTNQLSTTDHNPIALGGGGNPEGNANNGNGNGNNGNGNGGGGSTPALTLHAHYSASSPIDTSSVVFLATDTSGNIVQISQGAGGYTLTLSGSPLGVTADFTYAVPAGVTGTATASLFAHDINGNGCGQVAWSSCPVSVHDNFMETDGNGHGIADHGMNPNGFTGQPGDADSDDALTATQLADAALLADADDSVFPGPGQTVGPGSQLGATYYDETDINATKTKLFLNGTAVATNLTSLGGFASPPANNYRYNLTYTLPSTAPNGWNSAFLYFWDADVNQTGGDCSLTQWAFKFAGGGGINLTE